MFTLEQIQDHIPKYLTPAEQAELISQLRDFEHRNYYTTLYASDMLQGDGWSGIEIINFADGVRDRIKGVLLSNSCDIAPSNQREFPPRIVFAPLVRLDAFAAKLAKVQSLKTEQIDSKLDAIRKQRVSSIFYLPQGGGLDADYMAVLDDLHNIPLDRFRIEPGRLKLFTLGQMGYYLFLLKLSIHFCRFQEAVSRDAVVSPAPNPTHPAGPEKSGVPWWKKTIEWLKSATQR